MPIPKVSVLKRVEFIPKHHFIKTVSKLYMSGERFDRSPNTFHILSRQDIAMQIEVSSSRDSVKCG